MALLLTATAIALMLWFVVVYRNIDRQTTAEARHSVRRVELAALLYVLVTVADRIIYGRWLGAAVLSVPLAGVLVALHNLRPSGPSGTVDP